MTARRGRAACRACRRSRAFARHRPHLPDPARDRRVLGARERDDRRHHRGPARVSSRRCCRIAAQPPRRTHAGGQGARRCSAWSGWKRWPMSAPTGCSTASCVSSEIARALMLDPDFLLLDEPAAGLSGDEIERLAGLIKAISRARHRRAAGGTSRRPDFRDLRSRSRCSISEKSLAAGTAGRDSHPQGGGQCLPRRLNRCWRSASLESGYGKIRVLHGIDLNMVEAGEVVALLGPNGAGKSTHAARAVGVAAGQCRLCPLRRPRHHQRDAARERRAPASCM